MSATSDVAPVAKRHGWLFKLGIAAGVLVVLVVILYFVVTSGAFISGVVLPKVGKAVNSDITVSSLSLSPWSEVELKDLKVVPNGSEPLLKAQTVRARYSLMDILHGKINVSEVTLDGADIKLVQNADGTSNLDPLLKSGSKTESKPAEKKSSSPAQLNIKNVNIKNARFELVKTTNGCKEVVRVEGLNLSVDQLQNGQTSKIKVDVGVSYDRSAATGAKTNATAVVASAIEAKLGGNFTVLLGQNLAPESASGGLRVDVPKASGEMSNLAALAVVLDCDWTPKELRKVALHLEQGGETLGNLSVSGPFSADTMDGKLKVDLSSIDRRVLNLVGKSMGIDFNKTMISSSNEIELKQKATVINVNGQLNVDNFSATLLEKKQTTPTISIGAAYQVSVDQNKKSALIEKFDLNGTANQNRFLHAGLSKAMPVSWGEGAGAPEEAALDLDITSFNLTDWQAFASDISPAGTLDTTLHLVSRGGGKQISVDLNSALHDFGAKFGSNQIAQAGINLSLKGEFSKTDPKGGLNKISLSSYQFSLSQNNQAALSVKGSGDVDLSTKAMDLKTALEVQLPKLLSIVRVPNVEVSSGTLQLDSHVVQSDGGKLIDVDLTTKLQNLTAQVSSNQLARAGVDLGLKAKLARKSPTNEFGKVTLDKCEVALSQDKEQAFSFSGAGDVDLESKGVNLKTALKVQVAKVLQIIKVPGIDATSGAVSFDGQVMQENGKQNVTGALAITGLSGTFKQYNLDRFETKLDADLSMASDEIQVRKLAGVLSLAGLPGGSVDVKATNNFKTKALTASVKVVDINQNLLRPFVAPALGDKNLKSVSINVDATTSMNGAGAMVFKGGLGVTNLVVTGSSLPASAKPLSVQLDFDGTLTNSTSLDLRQFQITLSPTDRAKNQIGITGQADWSTASAIFANLVVKADSVDVTPFYELATSNTNKPAAAQSKPVASASSDVEPDPVQLPVKQVTLGLNIGHFYLKQIEITNWLTTVKVESARVVVNPFQLVLNGAPLNSTVDLNLGVKGFEYQINLKLDRASVEPFLGSFAPDKVDMCKGLVIIDTAIKGTGIKEAEWTKSLDGRSVFALTNATVQMPSGGWFANLLQPIATTLQVPELLTNPLNSVSCNLTLGQGKMNLQSFNLKSDAFSGDLHGVVTFAVPLTNTPLNIPMTLSLKKEYLQRIPFFAAYAETNSAYIQLPLDIVKVGGTVGSPKAKLNLSAKDLFTTKNVTTILKGVESQVGGSKSKSIISDINGVLGGGQSNTATNTPATNSTPQSIVPAANKLLNGLFKK